MTPPLPYDEAARLEALHRSRILDTPPEAVFDDLTRLASRFCGTPIAAVSLVDAHHQWLKSAVGLPLGASPREASFCAHVILRPGLLIVPDARADPRFADNPQVTGPPGIRFYAGAPLIVAGGLAVGSLCVVDRIPRCLSAEQEGALSALARQAADRIEMRQRLALQEELLEERRRIAEERRQHAQERERLLQAVRTAADRQWAFLRDVLHSVTDGRLRLCHDRAGLPAPLAPHGAWSEVSASGGLRGLRGDAAAAAHACGMSLERGNDLITAVGEAAMNALVHGGGGRGRVYASPDTVQVWVEDDGGGIDMADLPRAALERGYTTAGTLGHGMKMMLEAADRIYLLTGTSGTTVVIEQDRDAARPAWALRAA